MPHQDDVLYRPHRPHGLKFPIMPARWYALIGVSLCLSLWFFTSGSAYRSAGAIRATCGFVLAKDPLISGIAGLVHPGRKLRAGLLMLVTALIADSVLILGYLKLTGVHLF